MASKPTPTTSTPVKQQTMFDFMKSGVGNMQDKAGNTVGAVLEKVGIRKSPTPSPPKEAPVKMSDVEKGAEAAGPLNDISNISGVKRTSSGKLSQFPGRESLITMNSRLENAADTEGETSPRASPPRKRRPSASEDDVFEKIESKVVGDVEASPRPLQVVPENLLAERKDMTKAGEQRAIKSALEVIGQHAALVSDEEISWDPNGDVNRSLYEETDHPLPIQEMDDYETDDEEEPMGEKSKTPVNDTEHSQSPELMIQESLTSISDELASQHRKIQSMLSLTEKNISNQVAEQDRKMTQQYSEIKVSVMHFHEFEAQVVDKLVKIDGFESKVVDQLGKMDDLNVGGRLGDLELKFAQLLAKDKLKDAEIEVLKKTVTELQTKVTQLTSGGVAAARIDGAVSLCSGVEGGETFTQSELKDLKNVIVKHHREETHYWNRSVRVVGLGPLAKGAGYNDVFELLKKKGLEAMIRSCDNFFIHASGVVQE